MQINLTNKQTAFHQSITIHNKGFANNGKKLLYVLYRT